MAEQQMADFDQELAEELRTYDEFRDGDTVQGTIDRVEGTDNGIRVYVDLIWNEEIYRYFKRPQYDPNDEFEKFVNSIGYELNAAENIADENVPCKFNEADETWEVVIPETRREKVASSFFSLVSEKEGEEEDPGILFIALAAALTIISGYVLLAPLINAAIWSGAMKHEISHQDGEVVGMFIFLGGLFSVINIIWYLSWGFFYFGGNEFIPYLPL